MSLLPKLDVITQTCAAAILFSWLALADDIRLLAFTFLVALLIAVLTRLRIILFLTCILVPVLPIFVSHLVLEPFLSGKNVTIAAQIQAIAAWLRIAGMTLLSVTWLSSMNLPKTAQLCRLAGPGQFILLPLQVATTFVAVMRDRWLAIRELHSLRGHGTLRKRLRVRLTELPNMGLQLTMASLISSGELALACAGRGIGSRRVLSVESPKVSGIGIMLVLTMSAGTVFLVFVGTI